VANLRRNYPRKKSLESQLLRIASKNNRKLRKTLLKLAVRNRRSSSARRRRENPKRSMSSERRRFSRHQQLVSSLLSLKKKLPLSKFSNQKMRRPMSF
jgi:hypothetical protein